MANCTIDPVTCTRGNVTGVDTSKTLVGNVFGSARAKCFWTRLEGMGMVYRFCHKLWHRDERRQTERQVCIGVLLCEWVTVEEQSGGRRVTPMPDP
ncbi:hypothetical protein BaRGS_00016468 [Batillaria attramentaria]|uniref:Uncharacterized protein n=1 Tax=Batillaria attramentaria TaxID=370345 RepID=A0ABD0KYR5_9CAEN